MADGKEKKDKKPSSSSGGGVGDGYMDALFWIVLIAVIISFISFALGKLGLSSSTLPSFASILKTIFDGFQVLSVFLCLAFFAGIVYCNIKIGEVIHHHGGHDAGHGHSSSEVHHGAPQISSRGPNKRWETIMQRMSSVNEADWRLGIIEADIILGDMLKKMGYPGENIADNLKMVEPSDFKTLQNAWDAHKVRNNIAHQGSSYVLSKGEANEAIKNYKKVFEEFYFI